MIEGHEKFRMQDEEGGKTFYIEVNWRDDPKINDCKVLRFTFPDGSNVHILKEHLNAVLFAIGTADEQRKMIPQTIRRSKWYETIVSVKAKRDIAKGEDITFPIKITLPSVEQEAIAEIKQETGLYIPVKK